MGNKETPAYSRRMVRKADGKLKAGRTIAEKREKLETSSERMEARKKGKKRQFWRVLLTVVGFLAVAGLIIWLIVGFLNGTQEDLVEEIVIPYAPTIEVIDEDAAAGGKITNRMNEYIGQAEADFRELGYKPIKAVIPTGMIREVNFYLEGISGYIKTTIDRGSGVSVEDADRMIRYLQGIGVGEFQYIDVRVEGKGYWK